MCLATTAVVRLRGFHAEPSAAAVLRNYSQDIFWTHVNCFPGVLSWYLVQDYKAAQRIAAEKEAQFLPKVPAAATPSALPASTTGGSEAAAGSEADIENQALLQEQRLIETRAMDNTVAFQEALIEERDHGIQGERQGSATEFT